MSKKAERSVTASFEARELAVGVWHLSGGAPGGVEIVLGGAEPDARAALENLRASRAVIAWEHTGVLVTLTAAAGPRRIRAHTAILHEPRPALYEGLPLVKLDAAARRFWRRVFLLVRIPGGRRLLGLVARRAGGGGRK
ncbi:MAG TPA: hypothetical protein VHY75_07570 [Steroidobacteraceae bacterium]|jgi:hypothetical protein|nr:hypothetical protein [Steroidobacteraceae bacterium]